MTDNKNKPNEPEQNTGTDKTVEEKPLNVKNPFNKNDNKTITPEDVEGMQEFKEAQTERD